MELIIKVITHFFYNKRIKNNADKGCSTDNTKPVNTTFTLKAFRIHTNRVFLSFESKSFEMLGTVTAKGL